MLHCFYITKFKYILAKLNNSIALIFFAPFTNNRYLNPRCVKPRKINVFADVLEHTRIRKQ